MRYYYEILDKDDYVLNAVETGSDESDDFPKPPEEFILMMMVHQYGYPQAVKVNELTKEEYSLIKQEFNELEKVLNAQNK